MAGIPRVLGTNLPRTGVLTIVTTEFLNFLRALDRGIFVN